MSDPRVITTLTVLLGINMDGSGGPMDEPMDVDSKPAEAPRPPSPKKPTQTDLSSLTPEQKKVYIYN